MQAIKFIYVEILKSKAQLILLFVLTIVEFWMMRKNAITGYFYMGFAAVIVAAQPFLQEQTSEVGFINMLPVTKRNRVMGRYLYGAVVQLIAFLLSWITIGINYLLYHKIPVYALEATIGCFSIGLFFCALQYVIFYALGKMKSQQMAGIVMIMPGFVMFFGISYIIDFLDKYTFVIEWIRNNRMLAIFCLLLVGFIIWLIGIQGSTYIAEKKDFE